VAILARDISAVAQMVYSDGDWSGRGTYGLGHCRDGEQSHAREQRRAMGALSSVVPFTGHVLVGAQPAAMENHGGNRDFSSLHY
jgi:hypothetical protein